MSLASIADKVLLWIHARRLGLTSDGEPSQTSAALVLDGVPVGSTRGALLPSKGVMLTSAGSVSLTGTAGAAALVGDAVLAVWDATAIADVTASFESSISVAGAIQQTAGGTAGHVLWIFIQPQS